MWVSFEGWPAPRRNEGQNKRRHRVADNEERKIMKTTILLAIAAATGLSFAAGVNAGDLFTSTKGAQLQYDLRKVPGTTPEVPDRSVKAGSPKALDFAYSVRSVPGSTPDVLVRNVPAAPPRLLANEPWRFHQLHRSASKGVRPQESVHGPFTRRAQLFQIHRQILAGKLHVADLGRHVLSPVTLERGLHTMNPDFPSQL